MSPLSGVKTINIFVTWKNLKASKSFSLSVQKPISNRPWLVKERSHA